MFCESERLVSVMGVRICLGLLAPQMTREQVELT
jgi:hypothetical protein